MLILFIFFVFIFLLYINSLFNFVIFPPMFLFFFYCFYYFFFLNLILCFWLVLLLLSLLFLYFYTEFKHIICLSDKIWHLAFIFFITLCFLSSLIIFFLLGCPLVRVSDTSSLFLDYTFGFLIIFAFCPFLIIILYYLIIIPRNFFFIILRNRDDFIIFIFFVKIISFFITSLCSFIYTGSLLYLFYSIIFFFV